MSPPIRQACAPKDAKARFEMTNPDYLVATFGASQGVQDYLDKSLGSGDGVSMARRLSATRHVGSCVNTSK
jgi:hypothetical protein